MDANAINEVHVDDFMKISKDLPHMVLEKELLAMGGGGSQSTQYKRDVLHAAGWQFGKLTSYGAHPQKAAKAFNIIREALKDTDEKDQLLELVANKFKEESDS